MPDDRSETARVLETLPNKMLLVETEAGDQVAVHASGAMRVAVIRLVPGDRVRIERSPFDGTKGRIVGMTRQVGAEPRQHANRATNETRIEPPSQPETKP